MPAKQIYLDEWTYNMLKEKKINVSRLIQQLLAEYYQKEKMEKKESQEENIWNLN